MDHEYFAIVLIVSGGLGLGVRKFPLHEADPSCHAGPIEMSVREQGDVNVPVWPQWRDRWSWPSAFFCMLKELI